MKSWKYNISIMGYGFRIRNNNDFNRIDMTKSERRKLHRKLKLQKRNETREERSNY